MKGNKINGILWILLVVFLTGILIRGLNGKNWRNIKFWTWNNEGSKDWNTDDDFIAESNDSYTEWTFDADSIRIAEIGTVSEHVVCQSNNSTDKITVKISNNVNVRKIYNVGIQDDTFYVKRNSVNNLISLKTMNSSAKEIIVYLPEVLLDKIQIENVSGKTEIRNLRGRKINIENVSGKIEAENLEGRLKIENVSGKIEYSTNELKNDIDIESVSGKIQIELPKNSDFTCSYETVSGTVTTDFKKHGKKSGDISNGAETYELHVETVSGGIEVKSK